MKLSQVAIQLYTLRDFIRTPDDIATTLKRVRAIGYEAVQVSGMGAIDEAELNRILDGEGLVCCATHEPATRILEEPEAIVERLQKLNCKFTAYPHPAGLDLSKKADVDRLIPALDHSGGVLAAAGLTLTYHNHGIEFFKIDGVTALDRIYAETRPEALKGELDTYWVHFGGGDVVAWCGKLSGRLPLLHLKDYRMTAESTPTFCEIGNGTLDFPRIISAAEASGCEWFIVEQDTCPGDPFDSIQQSFEYISAQLIA